MPLLHVLGDRRLPESDDQLEPVVLIGHGNEVDDIEGPLEVAGGRGVVRGGEAEVTCPLGQVGGDGGIADRRRGAGVDGELGQYGRIRRPGQERARHGGVQAEPTARGDGVVAGVAVERVGEGVAARPGPRWVRRVRHR